MINLYLFNREAVHLGIRTVCPLCDKPVTRLDLHVSVPSLRHWQSSDLFIMTDCEGEDGAHRIARVALS